MTIHPCPSCAGLSRASTSSVVTRTGWLGRFLGLLALWRARVRERRALAAMDERLLRDVAISRIDAAREYDKPFWRS